MSGVYLQDVFAARNTLDLVGSLRWNHASYESKAANSPLVNGEPLWPDDSLSVDRLTYRAGLTWRARTDLTLSASVGSGFRAPHVTDLGTLGLTGAGFEVSSDAVEGLGGTVGTSAAATAVSSGQVVEQQKPELSRVFEASVRYHHERLDTRLFAFLNDVDDNITKQALILPQGAVGTSLGDEPIVAQAPTGVVFVAASAAGRGALTRAGERQLRAALYRDSRLRDARRLERTALWWPPRPIPRAREHRRRQLPRSELGVGRAGTLPLRELPHPTLEPRPASSLKVMAERLRKLISRYGASLLRHSTSALGSPTTLPRSWKLGRRDGRRATGG